MREFAAAHLGASVVLCWRCISQRLFFFNL
jgi:hypothetical protein